MQENKYRAEAERLTLDEGFSWQEAADELNRLYPEEKFTYNRVRGIVRKGDRWKAGERSKRKPSENKARERKPEECQGHGEREYPKSDKINKDGSRESFRILEIYKNHIYTPDELLKLHGFDPAEEWELIDAKSNIWNGTTGKQRNNELVELRQSTVRAKPKKSGITFSDVDHYFDTKQFTRSKPIVNPLQYDPNGEVLEIDAPDLHNGLLSWEPETGADYDIHIAKERFLQVMYDIKERCVDKKYKKIAFATLGDLLHVDNDVQTTTKGTPQQVDGRIAKIFDITCDMLIEGIDILESIAPVEVIYLPGNHDRVTGYMLLKAISLAYRFDKNITFDTTPNPQKHRLWGKVLVGLVHGDIANKNMGTWLQDRARKDYGQAQFVEVHAGHIHTEKRKEIYTIRQQEDTTTEDIGGIVIRYLPTISNSSYWEHLQGYPAGCKTMMCFVWNEQTGLREMWYSNV
jgi:hypothetical protein